MQAATAVSPVQMVSDDVMISVYSNDFNCHKISPPHPHAKKVMEMDNSKVDSSKANKTKILVKSIIDSLISIIRQKI